MPWQHCTPTAPLENLLLDGCTFHTCGRAFRRRVPPEVPHRLCWSLSALCQRVTGGFVLSPARWAAQGICPTPGKVQRDAQWLSYGRCWSTARKPGWIRGDNLLLDISSLCSQRVPPDTGFSAGNISSSCFPESLHIWLFLETYGSDPAVVTPNQAALEQTGYQGNLQPKTGEILSSVWRQSIEGLKKIATN